MRSLELAQAAIELRRYPIAEKHLISAIAEDPDHELPYSLMAFVMSSQKRWGESQAFAREAIARNSSSPVGYTQLAYAILCDPNHSVHPNDRLRTGMEAESSHFQVASRLAEIALSIDPEDVDSIHVRGLAAYLDEQLHEAMEWTQQGLRRDTNHYGCTLLRIYLLRRLQRHDEARHVALGCLQHRPEDAEVHHQLAEIEIEAGNHHEALQHARLAIRQAPNEHRYRDTYWDSLRLQYPMMRPIVAWEFFVRRFVQPHIHWITVVWILGLGILDGFLSKPFFSPILGPWIVLLLYERLPLSLVDLWLAKRPGFEFMLEKNRYWIRAIVWLLAAVAYLGIVYSAVYNEWNWLEAVGVGVVIISLAAGVVSWSAWIGYANKNRWLRYSLVAPSTLAVAMILWGASQMRQDQLSSVRPIPYSHFYWLLGGLLLGLIGPVVISAILLPGDDASTID